MNVIPMSMPVRINFSSSVPMRLFWRDCLSLPMPNRLPECFHLSCPMSCIHDHVRILSKYCRVIRTSVHPLPVPMAPQYRSLRGKPFYRYRLFLFGKRFSTVLPRPPRGMLLERDNPGVPAHTGEAREIDGFYAVQVENAS